jgi:hypothetical protein
VEALAEVDNLEIHVVLVLQSAQILKILNYDR